MYSECSHEQNRSNLLEERFDCHLMLLALISWLFIGYNDYMNPKNIFLELFLMILSQQDGEAGVNV